MPNTKYSLEEDVPRYVVEELKTGRELDSCDLAADYHPPKPNDLSDLRKECRDEDFEYTGRMSDREVYAWLIERAVEEINRCNGRYGPVIVDKGGDYGGGPYSLAEDADPYAIVIANKPVLPAPVEALTRDKARELTDSIRRDAETLWNKIILAYQGRADIALGYESWDAYCKAEFESVRLRFPREEREQAVRSLRESGLSDRAIESATGISRRTLIRDRQKTGGDNVTTSTSPKPVVGTDGKTYQPQRKPAPQPQPAPKPEPVKSSKIDACGSWQEEETKSSPKPNLTLVSDEDTEDTSDVADAVQAPDAQAKAEAWEKAKHTGRHQNANRIKAAQRVELVGDAVAALNNTLNDEARFMMTLGDVRDHLDPDQLVQLAGDLRQTAGWMLAFAKELEPAVAPTEEPAVVTDDVAQEESTVVGDLAAIERVGQSIVRHLSSPNNGGKATRGVINASLPGPNKARNQPGDRRFLDAALERLVQDGTVTVNGKMIELVVSE